MKEHRYDNTPEFGALPNTIFGTIYVHTPEQYYNNCVYYYRKAWQREIEARENRQDPDRIELFAADKHINHNLVCKAYDCLPQVTQDLIVSGDYVEIVSRARFLELLKN